MLPNLQNINITILPVIIIPVTGLCCLVFYNRLAALNALIHTITRDFLNLYLNPPPKIIEKQKSELKTIFKLDQEKLLQRSNLIRWAIVICFSGLICFILSAISIMMSVYHSYTVIITLMLWMLGASLFSIGLLTGIVELKSPALQNITMMLELLKLWERENRDDAC